jgi:tetratricopeptide (TPR) repeat protein
VKAPPTDVEVERLGGDLTKIARAYGVSRLVVPALTVSGDSLELTIQLVEAGTRRLLWSDQYRGARDGYLDLVGRSGDGLTRVLISATDKTAPPVQHTGNSEFVLAMQRGHYYQRLFMNRGLPADLDRAAEAFNHAFDLEPTRAEAAAAIAGSYLSRVVGGSSLLEVAAPARSWAERAIQLDPQSSRGWGVLADLESGRDSDSYRRKLESALKAVAFGPTEAYAHNRLLTALAPRSYVLGYEVSRRASELDPLSLTGPVMEAVTLSVLGRHAEANARLEHVLGIEPGLPLGLLTKALALENEGRGREALDLVETLTPFGQDGRLHPQWLAFARLQGEFLDAAERGAREAQDAALQPLVRIARGEAPFNRWESLTQTVAPLLVRHASVELAVEVMQERQRRGIVDPFDFLILNPDLHTVRANAGIGLVVQAARVQFDQMIALLEEAQARGDLPRYLEQPLADLLVQIRAARQT